MPTDSDVWCLRNGTLGTVNETAFGSYGYTFASLVIHCIKMFRLVVVVVLNGKKALSCVRAEFKTPRGNMTATVELTKVSYSCARFSYCSALFHREGRQLSGQQ